jgi:hypothetical protein
MRVYYRRYGTPFLSISPCDIAGAGAYVVHYCCGFYGSYLVVTADMTTTGSADPGTQNANVGIE